VIEAVWRARRTIGAALTLGLLVSLSACAVNLPSILETSHGDFSKETCDSLLVHACRQGELIAYL
jgi:hypothetical protein